MTHKIERAEIVAMLAREAEACGTDLPTFFALGSSDELDNPRLRDLWLIWGDVLRASDVTDATTAA